MKNLLLLVAFASLVGAAHVDAKAPENKGKPAREQADHKNGNDDLARDITDLARITIGIDAARRLAVDNSLVGQKPLPPGIRKNLARGKPLPPGIAKRSLPAPFLNELPRYPGHEWHMAGSDLVLVAVASGIIADVLLDVFD